MKLIKGNKDKIITINGVEFSHNDLGWNEGFEEYQNEITKTIINPISNYETKQFTHKPYPLSEYNNFFQNTIWYQFYFLSGSTFICDYEPTGISSKENSLMINHTTKSFFTLEFYRTTDGEKPNRLNRKLAFRKKLPLPLGEKFFYTPLNDYIFKPIFYGSSFQNKENMTIFWLKDKNIGNLGLLVETLWFTAKFYNAEDGSIIDFTNRNMSGDFISKRYGHHSNPVKFYQKDISNPNIIEDDLYYKGIFNWVDYTYVIEYDGSITSINNCNYTIYAESI